MTKNPVVYIVDDTEIVRETVTDMIYMFIEGCSTQQFYHGDGLCGLIGGLKENPAAIIMDTEMSLWDPGKTKIIEKHLQGYHVCEAIRREYGNSIPIIGMSAKPGYKEAWINAGANQFIDKGNLVGFVRDELPKYLEK